MVGGHRQVYSSYGPEEKRVDRPQRADSPPVYALHGQALPRGHREGPLGPQPIYRVDRPGWLLPLEAGPAGTDPPRPPPSG